MENTLTLICRIGNRDDQFMQSDAYE